MSLAYEFSYQDRFASTAATAVSRHSSSSVTQIAAFIFTRMDWQRQAENRLMEVVRLPVGWDGHQGRPSNPSIANYVYSLLEKLMVLPGLPLPSITPVSYGGIVLEWHRKGWDVEIEIDVPSSHHVYAHELATGIEGDFWCGSQLNRMRDVVRKISD